MNRKILKKLLSLLTVFAMVFSMIAVVQPMQANAATVDIPISNGGFENGAFGGAISGSNGATIVEKATYEGNYALKFDATGEILTVTAYLSEATAAEESITLSFWAKVLSGSTGNSVNYGVFRYSVSDTGSWTMLGEMYGAGYPVVGGDWKQISQTVTAAAGTEIIQAQIYLGSEGTTAIIDNVSITDGSGKELLTSGGFEKGALNGDFNANDALEIVCTPVHSGKYAAHADLTSGKGMTTTTIYLEPSTEARTMSLSYWLYIAPTATANGAHNSVLCFDTSSGSWKNLSTKSGAQYASYGVWTQKTLEVAVAANTNTLQIQLYAQDNGADFYIDDLSLTETVPDALPNTDLTLDFSYVNVDDTWYFTTNSIGGTNGYYKMSILVDGVEQTVNMQRYADGFRIWPNQFQNSVVPTNSLIIPAGTVMSSATETITVTEKLEVGYADGKWSEIVPNYDITVDFSNVQSDGAWQLTGDTSKATASYYKMNAIVDGTEQSVKLSRTSSGFTIWANFFVSAPEKSLVIPANTVLTAIDSTNHWAVIEDAATLTITNALDVSCVNGVWGITIPNTDLTVEFSYVNVDNTWYFTSDSTEGSNGYYKMPVLVDGVEQIVNMQRYAEGFRIWPNQFQNSVVPTGSLVISAGTVMSAANETITVLNEIRVENAAGVWQDMGQYADVTFTELKASDLNVHRTEDQSASQYRSTFGIEVLNGIAIGNEGWGNFTEVASRVLVNGEETSAVFGMVPADDGSWGKESAFMLYITGEGYRDAATTASSVTICAGTTLISPVDNTKGIKFTEDFVMYKNDDGSWDTTEDPTVETTDITLSLQTVTGDGTWQFVPSQTLANTYYKVPVTIDGTACNVLMGESQGMMCIYPNFFTQLGGKVPAESFVISAGTMMKAVDENGWVEIEGAEILKLTQELKIENIAGKWYEMSKYADVTFTKIWSEDLDLYYQNIMRLGDYSDLEVQIALNKYPEYKPLYDIYGRDANMTTFGIYSTIPTLQIPNDAFWTNFTLLGTVSVNGAAPAETYVMQTPDSSDDAETAMTNGFLIRFYNGFVADKAASVTIEPGTRIVTKDGTAGFVFVNGYTIYRDENGNWSDTAPAGTNPVKNWGLTLGDQIGVKFEVNAGMEVSFAVNGNAVTAAQDGNVYTIYLAAAQMNDEITVSVNGNVQEKTYSIRQYADIILADSGYGERTHNLVKNMLAYGGAAQNYFGYNANNLASAGIEVTAAAPEGDGEIAVSGGVSGISFYGAALVHENKTAVRFYFTGSAEGLTFTANGSKVSEAAKGERYYVEISGINPQDLGNEIEIVVSNGTDSLTVAYSPLDYMVRMYEKGSETTQALVQALYGYYQAAVAYTA